MEKESHQMHDDRNNGTQRPLKEQQQQQQFFFSFLFGLLDQYITFDFIVYDTIITCMNVQEKRRFLCP